MIASLNIQGSIQPQRGKNQGKSDKIFFYTIFLRSVDDKTLHRCTFLSRTRVHARLPTAMLIFCCHKCHTRRKIRRKNSSKFSQDTEKSRKKGHKTRILRCIFKLISAGQPPHLLKHIHNHIITNRKSTPYLQTCDTCDSKNTKTPVTRAYAYAREGVIIWIFTFPQTQFLISVSPLVFFVHPIVH